MKKIILGASLILFLIILFLVPSLYKSDQISKDLPSIVKIAKDNTVIVKDSEVKVEIADEPLEQQRGLSGRESLKDNEGMIFIFGNQDQIRAFWMKGMLIPLDIIWINDGKVAGIEKDIPAPDPETPSYELEIYSSKVPIDYVLEVNAGFSDEHDIQIGDSVEININQ